MTDARTTDTTSRRQQTRLALGAMLIPIFFVMMFALCIIGTYHKPHPHGIKVAVVGPAAQTAPLRAGLAKAAGSAFDISQAATLAEATHDVRERDLNAAFVPTARAEAARDRDRRRRRRAHRRDGGRDLARAVAAAQGAQIVVRDVRPLRPGTRSGSAMFMFMIVCTICGYLAVTLLFTVAPGLPPGRRYSMIAAVAS